MLDVIKEFPFAKLSIGLHTLKYDKSRNLFVVFRYCIQDEYNKEILSTNNENEAIDALINDYVLNDYYIEKG